MLTNEDLDQIKAIFRSKDDCEKRHDAVSADIHSLDQRFAVVTTKLNMLLGILGCIGAAVIGILVKMIIGG